MQNCPGLCTLAILGALKVISTTPSARVFLAVISNICDRPFRGFPRPLKTDILRINSFFCKGKGGKALKAEELTLELKADGGRLKVNKEMVPQLLTFQLSIFNAGGACKAIEDAKGEEKYAEE